MAELLVLLLEILVEVLFWLPADSFLARRGGEPREVNRSRWPLVWTALLGIVVGALLAAVTLLIWPNAFVRSFPLRLTHCLLSPVLAALLAQALERRRTGLFAPRRGVGAWLAYFLTAGFAFTRFFFAG